MGYFLEWSDLSEEFEYPREFRRLVELGLTEFEPWTLLKDAQLTNRNDGLRKRFPDRKLVPFARRLDNDDVAAWDSDRAGKVVILHDFASPGWEHQAEFATFYDWLRQVVDDFIEYDV